MENEKISMTGFQLPVTDEETAISNIRNSIGGCGSRVIMFPERFVLEIYENFRQSILYEMLEKLSEGRILVAGSVMERDHEKLFNRSYIFNDGKLLGTQDKIIPYKKERGVISQGNEINVFTSEFLTFSVAVCYDIDFPFFARLSCMNDTDIIFNPSLIRKDFHAEWHQYVKSRALENRTAVFSVNSITEGLGGNSIYVGTYEDGPGVRMAVLEAGRLKSFTVEHLRNSMKEKRIERIGEDPSTYNFPVKKIRY